ncbi:hypothetical protein [Tunicatimonas pelagia]|uniref:hypothetical protein n=1 Tax=Tunicatimonas pelagia TaxID=931531 RepID=UPI0026650593|nr:hypothetical protein [Tunicatimonas pelagia]WKN44643.1 hypothetical protein P0M28_06655 [Tunicatimonas pelagia]
MLRSLLWISLVGWLLACESETIEPSSARLGFSYFPIEVGNFREYAVQDISYSLLNEPDTQRYFLREVVADSFPGQGNELIYRLERFSRFFPDQAWVLDSVWTARVNTQRAVVVENNTPFIKLVFPFTNKLVWDGNALNAKSADRYELQTTPEALLEEIESTIDTLLTQSITVVQSNVSSLVSDSIFSETYVDNVGLFYKKSVNIAYCAEEDCLGQFIIDFGRDYRQTLTAYGKID